MLHSCILKKGIEVNKGATYQFVDTTEYTSIVESKLI